MVTPADPWASGKALRGAACITGALKIAELAGRVGFDLVWIEVEHGGASWAEVEAQCMAAESGGAVPCVRVPDYGRQSILRALEAGARLVIVPMVNDTDAAREVVRHGKFPPLGERGFNTRSRGLNYSLNPLADAFARANETTYLIAQIETMEAVKNLEAICAVEGLAGVLVGPGDLSVSYGRPGAFTDPEYIALVADVMRRARAAGKHAGILVAPGPMLDATREAGCDFFFCAGDINDLARTWKGVLAGL
jgi:2-keto-3-deoxy-L-rhamnonate aldolase RhmA